jgi:hypothetical protein
MVVAQSASSLYRKDTDTVEALRRARLKTSPLVLFSQQLRVDHHHHSASA